MDEATRETGSRREQSEVRKNARAKKLIGEFVEKLRRLAGNEPIPDKWRALTIKQFGMDSLSRFVARFMASKETIKGRRGRPRTLSEDDNARLLNTIESVKAELCLAQSKPATDKDAIGHWIKDSEPSISGWRLKKEMERVAKLLSRARPPHKRRPKKKSQKSLH